MKKLKSYRLFAFAENDVVEEVRLFENILIKAFKRYKGENFLDNCLETDLIKVMLDKNLNTALNQCKEFKYKNKTYVAWFATPGMMKKEDKDYNKKCEMYFINKEYKDFADKFEHLISLGKIKDYYGMDRVINKELARIALATSSSIETNLKPKIIILPECTHTIISNIVTIENNKVVEKKNYPVQTTPFDGCGLMSLDFADKIKNEVGVDYPVSFAGIRMYNGLAVKGLITSIDFISYFDEYYAKDTDYFKKENGKYYIKDMFGDWQCANDADLILNETQCKWADNFKSVSEVNDFLKKDEFKEYKDLLSNLYITKINKPDEDIKDYTLSNYQLLGNLAITEKEINLLSAETERIYKEILNGNEDIIRIYWGDIIRNNDFDDEGNLIIEEESNPSTQAQQLLEINPEFIKSGYVKRAIGRIVTKKIKQLAAGKFYIKSDFKTLTQDPLTYLDWIMNRNSEVLMNKPNNGLEANQFYCTNIQDGEVRTISRNPLNSFSEILNIEFSKNNILDKYLGHLSKEICVFNAYDLTPAILSGCDFDLDIALVVDEPIIINSVVTDLPFINLDDGEYQKMKFNKENRLKATLLASGKLIGSLAMEGAGVSNLATLAGYKMYKSNKNNEIYNYDTLKDAYFKKKDDVNFEKFQEILDKNFKYIEDYYSEKELKEQIKQGLYKYRRESYLLRNLQMVAIDAPKTLVLPKIPKEFKFKRPRYLKYVKDHLNNKNTKNVSNALNLHATRVAHQLLSEDVKLVKTRDNLKLIKKYLTDTDYAFNNQEDYENCKKEIGELFQVYADKNYINQPKDDKTERLRDVLTLENNILAEADRIISNYDYKIISHALASLECSEKFIFKFFFKAVAEVIKENSINYPLVSYFEDKYGNIKYLHKKYKRIEVVKEQSNNIENLHNKTREQTNKKLGKLNDSFTHQVRVCFTTTNINMNELKEAWIGTQLYKDTIQPVLFDISNNKIGFIFYECNQIDDFRKLTDFEDKKVDIKLLDFKNNKATIVLSA